jgi:hypothetical protein
VLIVLSLVLVEDLLALRTFDSDRLTHAMWSW